MELNHLEKSLLQRCWQILSLNPTFRLFKLMYKHGEQNLFHFSFHDVNCCVSHKTSTLVKILCSIFLVCSSNDFFSNISFSFSFSFSGVCLYDIAELLVPCFKNEEIANWMWNKKKKLLMMALLSLLNTYHYFFEPITMQQSNDTISRKKWNMCIWKNVLKVTPYSPI